MGSSANRLYLRGCILALALCASVTASKAGANEIDPIDRTIREASQRFDAGATQRMQAWHDLLASTPGLPIEQQLERVNQFFNAIPFVDDEKHWGRSDYWATPVELLVSGGGDCEDFAIAKYFTLRQLGIPAEQLRITYVRASRPRQAHMVLAYYERPDDEPMILDNLQSQIQPASQRDDLRPVYGFNGESIWLVSQLRGRGELVGGSHRIGRWQHLRTRMQTAAGFSLPQ